MKFSLFFIIFCYFFLYFITLDFFDLNFEEKEALKFLLKSQNVSSHLCHQLSGRLQKFYQNRVTSAVVRLFLLFLYTNFIFCFLIFFIIFYFIFFISTFCVHKFYFLLLIFFIIFYFIFFYIFYYFYVTCIYIYEILSIFF